MFADEKASVLSFMNLCESTCMNLIWGYVALWLPMRTELPILYIMAFSGRFDDIHSAASICSGVTLDWRGNELVSTDWTDAAMLVKTISPNTAAKPYDRYSFCWDFIPSSEGSDAAPIPISEKKMAGSAISILATL